MQRNSLGKYTENSTINDLFSSCLSYQGEKAYDTHWWERSDSRTKDAHWQRGPNWSIWNLHSRNYSLGCLSPTSHQKKHIAKLSPVVSKEIEKRTVINPHGAGHHKTLQLPKQTRPWHPRVGRGEEGLPRTQPSPEPTFAAFTVSVPLTSTDEAGSASEGRRAAWFLLFNEWPLLIRSF